MKARSRRPKPAGDLPRSIIFPPEDLAALEVLGALLQRQRGIPPAATTQAELIRLAVRALIVRYAELDDDPQTRQGFADAAPGAVDRWRPYVRAIGL